MPYTLTVNFNAPSSGASTTGYRVKYWPVSNPANITTVLISNSPFQVNGLAECCYAGTIESICGSGQYSSAQSFSADIYYYYNATKFDCGNACAQVGASGSIVARSTASLSTASGLYYKSGTFTYQLTNVMATDPTTFDVNLDGLASNVDCTSLCTPTVTSANAGFEPCIGGTVDDHLGGQISLSAPVTVDTGFNLEVTYASYPNTCSSGSNTTVNLSGTILANQSTGSVVACSSGIYVSGGGTVCSTVGTLQ